MKITKRQLKRIIKEERHRLVESSLDLSFSDLAESLDEISETLDMLADKYVTSGWLYSHNNVIAEKAAERLEQLYRDAETMGAVIRGSGVLKDEQRKQQG